MEELLGLPKTWLMVPPVPELAPVMLPVLVPNVQVNVLGIVAVRLMFGPVPLQVLSGVALVRLGAGITFTVISVTGPMQEPVVDVGVTI